MASDDGEEPLETLAPRLDDLVGEAVGEDLAGERGDVYAGGFVFEDVAEGFKVGVAPPYDGVAQLKGGDVRMPLPWAPGL